MSWQTTIRAAQRTVYEQQGKENRNAQALDTSIARVDQNTFQSMRATRPVTMSPSELVAMCASGMGALDLEIARKTATQRKAVGTLKTLTALKAQLSKHAHGLERNKDEDTKRGGGSETRGKNIRRTDFEELDAAYRQAKAELPPDLQHIASENIATMHERNNNSPSFSADQGNRMTENIESGISDINTRQQAEMAEINNLVSKRSNVIEMTKNLVTALSGQQEFISRNAPR